MKKYLLTILIVGIRVFSCSAACDTQEAEIHPENFVLSSFSTEIEDPITYTCTNAPFPLEDIDQLAPCTRSICLSDNNLRGTVAFFKLIKNLPLLSHLQILEISSNQLNDRDFQQLSFAFKTTPELQELNLSHNKLTFNPRAAQYPTFPPLLKLRTLNLSHNLITSEGAKQITFFLQGMPNLEMLQLADNMIGDTARPALQATIFTLRTSNLKIVDLRLNQITAFFTRFNPYLPPQKAVEILFSNPVTLPFSPSIFSGPPPSL